MSIVADHGHPFIVTIYPSRKGCLYHDNVPCPKAEAISNWFHHENVTSLLQWYPQAPDLNPIEHLCDMVWKRIHSINVHLTSLQKLRDAIISTWNRIELFHSRLFDLSEQEKHR